MTAGVDEVGRSRHARFGEQDLAGLIRIYEASYVRLARLVPDLAASDGVMVSRVAGALDLYLEVIEHQRYTTSLRLTYRFADGGGHLPEPDARINAYHDVRAAELVSHCRRRKSRGVRPWIRGRMPELDRKWRMNRFLLKWLRFCAFQGHLFIPGITPVLQGVSLAGGPPFGDGSALRNSPSQDDGPSLHEGAGPLIHQAR